MTYEQFLAVAVGRSPMTWRRGQFVFNALYNLRPDLAEAIRGTEADPFYRNDRIPAALAYLEEHWDDGRAPHSATLEG